MNRLCTLLLAFTLFAAMLIPAQADSLNSITTYIISSNWPVVWNIHFTQAAADLKILVNLTDALTTYNASGVLTGNAARSWEVSEDGRTWTFHLRRNMRWYDYQGNVKGTVKAQDWLTAMEWVLNYHKNWGYNVALTAGFLEGAEDYYNYTGEMEEANARALTASDAFSEMVGIEAPDDYTLVYHLTKPFAAFGSVTSTNAFCPLSQSFLNSVGVEGYQDITYENLWYSGAYTITDMDYESITLKKAAPYWNTASSRFDTITYVRVNSMDEAYELFAESGVDQVTLTDDMVTAIYNDPNHEYHDNLVETRPTKYSYEIHFCYAKNNEDGTPDTNWNRAVANESFRKALYYGLDMTDYLMVNNPIHPLSGENYTSIVPGSIVSQSGVDYTDMVLNELGLSYNTGSYSRYNAAQAAQFKQQAITELTAKGVTFPIHADYYIHVDASRRAPEKLQQVFSETLGNDFVVLDIKTYEASLAREVRNPALASFYINGWGLDFADPGNYLSQETYEAPGAYYANSYSKINMVDANECPELIAVYREFTRLVEEAEAIIDEDQRLAAFAVAEAYMIEHALVIPAYLSTTWELTRINSLSSPNVGFGSANYRMVNILTSDTLYTQEQMKEEKESAEPDPADFRVTARVVEEEAFRGIAAKEVEIASPCRVLGDYAFADCLSLRKVIIASSVETISDTAFDGCTSLTVYCEPGSAADDFAQAKDMSVIYTLNVGY